MPKKESSFTLLKKMRGQVLGPHLKRAADDSKVTFESNFYKLTDAIVSEQFPALKQYDIGFQLVDKSKDNSKAFGIRAFRLKTLIFIPFFYDNGKVYGYELIYMPKQNLIVPSSNQWISYLKRKSFDELGEEEESENFGDFSTSPNLLPLRRPLTFKVASYLNNLERVFKRKYTVPEALIDPGCSGAFLSLLDKYPYFVEKCASVYGKDLFNSMVKRAIESVKSVQNVNNVYIPVEKQIKSAAVRIYGPLSDPIDLDAEEIDQLNKKGYFIKDARDESEKSKVIQVPNRFNLTVISSPGVYEIIDANLNKRKIIVLFNAAHWRGRAQNLPRIEDIHKYYAILDNNSSPKVFNLYRDPIYYTKQFPKEEFDRVIENLPVITKNVIVNKVVPKELSDSIKSKDKNYNFLYGNLLFINKDGTCYAGENVKGELYLSKGDKLCFHHSRNGNLFVPETTRLAVFNEKSKNPFADASYILSSLTKVASPVKIYFDVNSNYVINNKRFEKLGALSHLVVDLGLSESDALRMIKTAELCKQARFFVKKAEDFPVKIYQEERPVVDFSGELPTEFAPGIRAVMVPYEVERWVPGLKRPRPLANIMEPPPLTVITTLKRISDANDGEVFDLGLLSGLLHNTRSAGVIKELVPDVMRGLDGLGRILFALYRHKDKFIDVYGKGDYERLLDQIRTNLELSGEVVMDIVQQKIDPYVRGFSGTESEEGIFQPL